MRCGPPKILSTQAELKHVLHTPEQAYRSSPLGAH